MATITTPARSLAGINSSPALPVVSFVGGFLSGKAIGYGVDKLMPYSPDPSGKFEMKALAKPLILLTVAGAAIYFGRPKANWGKKDQNGAYQTHKAVVRGMGYGLAAAAAISATERVLKIDLFGGLHGMGNTAQTPSPEYYRATEEEIAKMLNESQFTPSLPALPSGNEISGYGTELVVEDSEEYL